MEAKIILFSTKGNQAHEFLLKIHKSTNVSDQQIESSFYEEYSSVPQGVHYEIEIISPDVKQYLHGSKIHYHMSQKNSKDFICWTAHIPTPEQLVRVVNMWCAGTVHTVETGEDFARLYQIHDINLNDFEKMISILKEEYGIVFEYSKFEFNR